MATSLDDLKIGGFYIWQNTDSFRFGTDAVLLYNFIKMKPNDRIIDLCSGSGAVPLLLLAGDKAERVTALEIQRESCRLCRKSAVFNGCADRLKTVCGDVTKISDFFCGGQFDAVSVNPPYYPRGQGILPPGESVAVARHELLCTLKDVLAAACYLLRDNGTLYMVHRLRRKSEVLEEIHNFNLRPVEIQTVYSTPGTPSPLFLIAARKSTQSLPCKYSYFTVQNEDRTLSNQYKSIYEQTCPSK